MTTKSLKRPRSVSPDLAGTSLNKKSRYELDNRDYVDEDDDDDYTDYDSDDVIEEPPLFIKGVGSGKDCDTGNPENEWNRNEQSKVPNTTTCIRNLNQPTTLSTDDEDADIVENSESSVVDSSPQNRLTNDNNVRSVTMPNVDSNQNDRSLAH